MTIYTKNFNESSSIEDWITSLLNGVSTLWTKVAKTTGGVWSKVSKVVDDWIKEERVDDE